jgi:hypothetical protein
MNFWLALGLGLLGAWQAYQASQAQQRAIQTLSQGFSPEEIARMREQGTANLRLNLARRGLLDSGLLPGGVAALEGELALAQAAAKRGMAPALSSIYLQQAQQPSFLAALVPLLLQYGVQRPGGGWLIPPVSLK